MTGASFIGCTSLFLALISVTVFADSDVCSQGICGKGKCQSKPGNIPFGYVCECDSGWKQTRLLSSLEQFLQYLPCTVPNCTINYSCMSAEAPLPATPINPFNVSFIDPCYWAYCGEGTCTKSSDNTHLCQCQSGAYNLLNVSHFPCYKECAVGSDCSNLGIELPRDSAAANASSDSSPLSSSPSSASGNYAGKCSNKLKWMIFAMIFSVVTLFQGNDDMLMMILSRGHSLQTTDL